MTIVEWLVRLVRGAASYAAWIDWRHSNTPVSGTSGPAVGLRSQRIWAVLVTLGRWDFLLGVVLVGGLFLWMLYFA